MDVEGVFGAFVPPDVSAEYVELGVLAEPWRQDVDGGEGREWRGEREENGGGRGKRMEGGEGREWKGGEGREWRGEREENGGEGGGKGIVSEGSRGTKGDESRSEIYVEMYVKTAS